MRATQTPISALPHRLWDALIVGAGPAGSACAMELARRGHSVALVDRESFPRDKVCGGGLIADSVAALRRLEVWDAVRAAGHPLGVLSLFSPSQIEVQAHGEYLTIRRAVLDDLLAQRAASLGAAFCQGKIQTLSVEADGTVSARSADNSLVSARIAVLATGVRLGLARSLGMAGRGEASPDAVAICRNVRSGTPYEGLVASFDRSVLPGYAWIFPLGDGEYNVGCGIFHRGARRAPPDLLATFDAFVRQFPLAHEIFSTAEPCGPMRGAPLRCGLRGAAPLGRGPVLAVGETLGATFPFTGEGIGKALETGEMAAEAIHAALSEGNLERLRDYPERIDRELRTKYWGYQIAEAWIRWPGLIDFMARRVLKSRHLQRAASGILRETADPRTIFSVGGVLRSLLP